METAPKPPFPSPFPLSEIIQNLLLQPHQYPSLLASSTTTNRPQMTPLHLLQTNRKTPPNLCTNSHAGGPFIYPIATQLWPQNSSKNSSRNGFGQDQICRELRISKDVNSVCFSYILLPISLFLFLDWAVYVCVLIAYLNFLTLILLFQKWLLLLLISGFGFTDFLTFSNFKSYFNN